MNTERCSVCFSYTSHGLPLDVGSFDISVKRLSVHQPTVRFTKTLSMEHTKHRSHQNLMIKNCVVFCFCAASRGTLEYCTSGMICIGTKLHLTRPPLVRKTSRECPANLCCQGRNYQKWNWHCPCTYHRNQWRPTPWTSHCCIHPDSANCPCCYA